MTKKSIIGKKVIEEYSSIYTIAEIGINHEGNIDLCAQMIESAAKVGADAIKLQTIDPDENYFKDTDSYKLFKKAWLGPEETEKMFKYSRLKNVEPFTTVGDFKTLEWVKKLKPAVYKISSGLIDHIPLIRRISELNKPTIISTGTANEEEIDSAIDNFIQKGNKNLILLHCVSSYPTPYDQTNLSIISNMRNKYSYPIGYSDHALGYKAAIAATILGSSVIEKHFSFDPTRKDFDHKISLDANSFKKMVEEINFYKSFYGNKNTWISQAELNNKKWMRRIIVAKNTLEVGHKIKEEDIRFIRHLPGTIGIRPIELKSILGKVLSKKISLNMPIKKEDLHD